MVTGQCSNCHTMHNSQGGAPMAFQVNPGHTGYISVESPNSQLLLTNCVGCHTALDGYTWKDSTTGAPIVYNTVEPSEYLAGGNFYWVAQAGGDAKGHNVLGISGQDTDLYDSVNGAPGNPVGCGSTSCHYTLASTDGGGPSCCGCHMIPAHHADDSGPVVGAASPSIDGYYRFLSGHNSGNNHGVCGIEDDDWQATKGAGDHNEYLGWSGELEWAAGFYNLGHTMTAFCCGCHGNFHVEQDSSGSWLRHPSDAVLPTTGEYTAYSTYDPLVPVARSSLSTVKGTVSGADGDMVMCLSCHRPHGSPYYKLMRWDYKSTNLSTALSGCSKCHTSKN